MNYCLNKTRLTVSTIALSIVLVIVACDRHRYSADDEITKIDINKPMVEKFAKRGIEISEEERQEIIDTINKERLLDE